MAIPSGRRSRRRIPLRRLTGSRFARPLAAPEPLEDRRLLAGSALDGPLSAAVGASAPESSGNIPFVSGAETVLLHYEAATLAGGLTRYDVFLDDPTDALRSYFLDALSFSGLIQQDAAGLSETIRVNDDASAALFDGLNYDRNADTFFFQPFTDHTVAPGIADTGSAQGLAQRTVRITAGSGPGSKLDLVQIAQIVAQGNVTVGGSVSRHALNFFIPDGANRQMTASPADSPAEAIAGAVVALGAQRLLGHSLDATTAAAFQVQIEAGATRAQLAQQLWNLPENLANRVTVLYSSILHRAPTIAQRDAQVALISGGATEKQIARELLLSAEYNASHATNALFVDGLYADLLGRAADSAGRAAWLTALSTTHTRAQAIDAFLASAEYNGRMANLLSLQLLLHSAGAPPGAFDAGTFAQAILSSDEFARQALRAGLTADSRALAEALANRLSGRSATLDELAGVAVAQSTAPSRAAIVEEAWQASDHLARRLDSLYRGILHRPADPVGTAYYVPLLAAGAGMDSVVASLVSSVEYQSSHATNASYVDGLYRDLLGRAPDAAGRAAWLASLASGVTRAEAAQAFLNSTERRLRVIDAIYLELLARPADFGGRLAYLALWQQGSSADDLARNLLASDEFFRRFAV